VLQLCRGGPLLQHGLQSGGEATAAAPDSGVGLRRRPEVHLLRRRHLPKEKYAQGHQVLGGGRKIGETILFDSDLTIFVHFSYCQCLICLLKIEGTRNVK
jgi:hypothetical protein